MKLTTYLFLIFFLASCANKITSGNYVSEENLGKIQEKKLTNTQIIEIAGPPSIIQYDKDLGSGKKWIYVGRKYIKRAFLDSKIVNQEVVVINFVDVDLEESMYSVERFVDGYNQFAMDKTVTKDYVPQKNYLSQFFGNLGRFNKKAKDKKLR